MMRPSASARLPRGSPRRSPDSPGRSLAYHAFRPNIGAEEEGAAFDGYVVFGGKLFEADRPNVTPGSDVIGPDYGAYRLVVELGPVDGHDHRSSNKE